MKFSSTSLVHKYAAWAVFGLLTIGPLNQKALSQEVPPSFKIAGEKRMEIYPGSANQRSVEYDPYLSDHLVISYFVKGVLLQKGQFRFNGKKFYLSDFQHYLNKKELIRDGILKIFSADLFVTTEMIYKNDTLREQTIFYPNGEKQMTFAGNEKMLNGEFIMWHPNGKISFLGRYKENLKDGEFESFDQSGMLLRKGTYQAGKLIAGEAVVQDLVYDAPEVPAQYKGNDSILNKILIKKTANLVDIAAMDSTDFKILDLKFTIHKTGQILKVEIDNSSAPLDTEIIQTVFSKQFMDFQPALIEGAPVSSYFNKSFYLTNKGLEAIDQNTDSLNKSGDYQGVFTIVEDMPEFPGGEMGLRKFLANTVRYPHEAAEGNIQGKVFVQFVILEDGTVSNVFVVQSVHPLLDNEASRVVKAMPKWKPGRHDGKLVKVSYTAPINFVVE